MTKFIDSLLRRQRLTLMETQRALILRKGRFDTILGSGEHVLPQKDITICEFDLTTPVFDSHYEHALLRARPDLVEAHMMRVKAGPEEVVIVCRDGSLYDVIEPDTYKIYWQDAGEWSLERIDVSDTHELSLALKKRLMNAGWSQKMSPYNVSAGHVGILLIDEVLDRVLEPGSYWFWKLGRKHQVKHVDMRWQTKEVTGQEILTADRVTLRVNLSASYRVIDPVKAVETVADYVEALHRALQLAFRKTLGAMTLDRLLADKVSVDADAAENVRRQMAEIGLEVSEIALRDVILPGEMREILNQVVEAQKAAEANVIRRREETNATRSLLNTAKVMAENPVMLRLKELEALEKIAGDVKSLTIHNGTEGLMSDLVKLRD